MATQVGESKERAGAVRVFGAAAAAMLPMGLVAFGLAVLLPLSLNA